MGNQELVMSAYVVQKLKGTDIMLNAYRNMIISRWARSYRFGNDYIKLADSDSYFEAYTLYISQVISSANTTVRIATLQDETDVALGFSVTRGDILDYVHVQKDFRKQGIGAFLVPKNIKVITHLTRTAIRLWGKVPDTIFNPFA